MKILPNRPRFAGSPCPSSSPTPGARRPNPDGGVPRRAVSQDAKVRGLKMVRTMEPAPANSPKSQNYPNATVEDGSRSRRRTPRPRRITASPCTPRPPPPAPLPGDRPALQARPRGPHAHPRRLPLQGSAMVAPTAGHRPPRAPVFGEPGLRRTFPQLLRFRGLAFDARHRGAQDQLAVILRGRVAQVFMPESCLCWERPRLPWRKLRNVEKLSEPDRKAVLRFVDALLAKQRLDHQRS